jgi:NTE family protein
LNGQSGSRLLYRVQDSVSADDGKTKVRPAADRKVYNIVHLIYRSRHYEGH